MYNATWLAVSATATGSQGRGTRFRSYFKENGYQYFQGAIVWVVDGNVSLNRGFSSNTSVLWQGNSWEGREYQVHTLENMIPAQYHTGVTTIHSFQSDGIFVPLNATDKLGGVTGRRMEFIGDSITAATNVNRPEGAQAGCGDSGFQVGHLCMPRPLGFKGPTNTNLLMYHCPRLSRPIGVRLILACSATALALPAPLSHMVASV